MQTLYTLESMGAAKPEGYQQGATILDEKLKRGLDLFVIVLEYLRQTTAYASVKATARASKYLPTQEDLNASTKIAENTFLQLLTNNKTYLEKSKEAYIQHAIHDEWIRKLFLQLETTPEYENYIADNERNAKSEKNIIRFIWEELILKNESLMEYFGEELNGWEDDKAMTVMLMDNFFKSPSRVDFSEMISKEKRNYSHDLLRTVLEKKELNTELIQPKLVNWDSDRVALIDLLVLQMGVCELLYFPTIPTKVTINEYIEIAKSYSTQQSGQFVNGVLDNILKDLEKDNRIRKQDRIRK